MSQEGKPVSEPREDGDTLIGDATVVIGSFLPLTYAVLAVVALLADRPGIPTSPLIAAIATIPLAALLEHFEDAGESRQPRWAEKYPHWLTFVGIAIYVFAAIPLVIGLLWPLAIMEGLSKGVAFWLHFVPTIGLLVFMVASRYRYVRSQGCS
jgi:hypothetical protein